VVAGAPRVGEGTFGRFIGTRLVEVDREVEVPDDNELVICRYFFVTGVNGPVNLKGSPQMK
jgi:hypothetical protein